MAVEWGLQPLLNGYEEKAAKLQEALMNAIIYQKDSNKIVHFILDKSDASANLMDEEFCRDLAQCVSKLMQDDFIGVIIRSAKVAFFAGGDIDLLYKTQQENAEQLFAMVESIKQSLRQLETMSKPVVVCIQGAVLGGGMEIALAADYRIALNRKSTVVGFPEVTLGLLPGAGGVIRTTRMLGLKKAMPVLTEGKNIKVKAALELGLVDSLVDEESELLPLAIEWINNHPRVSKSWDEKGFQLPGGNLNKPNIAQVVMIAPAILKQKTAGLLPAPEKILAAMVEGVQVDFDTASQIESRYFVELACSQVSKNLINTFWYQLNQIKASTSRPANCPEQAINKVGVLGAGMMGAGIAYACANKGISVVLKDISLEAAEKGKQYSERLLSKKVSHGRISEQKQREILSLIQTSASATDLKGCELVIEAVFENRDLKTQVTQEAEQYLSDETIFASNTSTLPISGLARAAKKTENFIGLHFFSPVDKMPLVEIIKGEKTSTTALAKSYDFVQQIGKIPIVVNDSRGFFTSRVFATFVKEGIAMLGEGIAAESIENAASLAGFPVGPLAVSDEVSLTLIDKIRKQTEKDCRAEGSSIPPHPADKVVDQMMGFNRQGKLSGAGFYDYPEGQVKHLWSGLKQHFYKAEAQTELQAIKDRLLYIMALESIRCMQESVIESSGDANIGSIFGIGYPAWTGGVLQFINHVGLEAFAARAERFSIQFGSRFEPPELLKEKLKNGECF